MRSGRIKRYVVGGFIAAGVVVGSAVPAMAHFCRRVDFNEVAASRAGGSEAWLTADEWRQFLPSIGQFCPDAVPLLEDILDAADEHTLFMGPGLLAGGTIGKGNTPDHFAYMHEAFASCE